MNKFTSPKLSLAKNAAELLAKPNVDGGLIGGASLKPDDFGFIIAAVQKIRNTAAERARLKELKALRASYANETAKDSESKEKEEITV